MERALYTEIVGQRFEVACWREDGTRGILAQVLDLSPRTLNLDAQASFVSIEFVGYGRRAVVTSDHSTHHVLRSGHGWRCDCAAGQAGKPCYHKHATDVADRYCQKLVQEHRRQFPRVPAAASLAAYSGIRPGRRII